MKRLLFLFQLLSFAPTIYGQTFLNGSFENNTVTNCMYDIDNATFNSVMTNVKGIGELQTLGIFYYNNCPGFDSAQSGNYFVSLENTSDSTKSTAISMKLADTLQAGFPYTFCYYDRGLTLYNGPVEIGMSNNDSTFGTLIYTSPTCDTTWQQRTVSFNSPITGNYVTARYKHNPPPYDGLLIDNFGVCLSNGINEHSTKNSFKLFPNPTTDHINIQTNFYQKFIFNIYNSLGQLAKSGVIESNSTTIYLNELANGIYSIELLADNKKERKCFIVEKQSSR